MSKAKPDAAVTLFLGDGTVVDPLVRALVDERMGANSQALDFEVFRFGERPISEIESALRQVGMFATKRCVWLRSFAEGRRKAASGAAGSTGASADASDVDGRNDEEEEGDSAGDAGELLSLLEAGIPADTLLVVSAAALDARSRLFKWFAKHADVRDHRVQVEKNGRLGEVGVRRAVEAKLHELGVTRVASGALDEILKRGGNVLGETVQEVDRLVLGLADPTRLTQSDVRAGMRDLALGWVFDLTSALDSRNLAGAEDLIARLMAEGEAPLRLASLLSTHVAQLSAARPLVDTLPRGALRLQGAAFLNGPGASLPDQFRGWRGYFRLRAAANFSADELHRLHGQLLQLDLALKSSPAAPQLLFSRFLHGACISAANF